MQHPYFGDSTVTEMCVNIKCTVTEMLEWIAKAIVLLFLVWVWGSEMLRDIRFYKSNNWDFSKTRESNVFYGYIKSPRNSPSAKSRFFFWYPIILLFAGALLVHLVNSEI